MGWDAYCNCASLWSDVVAALAASAIAISVSPTLSDTFGENDFRKKIINTLKNNYLKGRSTSILSENLYINLLNVQDIIEAIKLILNKF